MKVRDDGQIAVTFALNSWPIETKKIEIQKKKIGTVEKM